MKEYDVVVLGSGEAGKYLAWKLAKQGLKTILVERQYIGGSCPNIACLPSKNVIHSAKVVDYVKHSEDFGISKGPIKIDMSKIRDRKRQMVKGLVEMHEDLFKKNGAELLLGSGKFTGPKTLEVTLADGTKEVIKGKKVILSTGSRSTIDPIPGLAESQPLTHIEALELDHIPEHLLILGGGYIGMEFAQAMRRFGSQVTIIERNNRLAHREDADVSEALQQLFKDEGISIVTDIVIDRVEGKSGEQVKLYGNKHGYPFEISGTDLLVASGRTPNNEGIGLELTGVELTDRGFIKVNEHLQTTAPDIWAVGDCAGSPHFSHIAYDDHRIVLDNIAGGQRVTTGRLVPYCLFTDPELAHIGLSETEAKAKGIAYRLAKIPMIADLRTRTLGETRGFMKALIDTKSDRILGFTFFGVDGGEIMGTVQVAMMAGLPYTALRDAIFTHPTLVEGLINLFSNVSENKK